MVAYASADVSHILVAKSSEANAKILKQELDVGVEGQYLWSYETDNGISAREQGALKNVPGVRYDLQGTFQAHQFFIIYRDRNFSRVYFINLKTTYSRRDHGQTRYNLYIYIVLISFVTKII